MNCCRRWGDSVPGERVRTHCPGRSRGSGLHPARLSHSVFASQTTQEGRRPLQLTDMQWRVGRGSRAVHSLPALLCRSLTLESHNNVQKTFKKFFFISVKKRKKKKKKLYVVNSFSDWLLREPPSGAVLYSNCGEQCFGLIKLP